MDKSLKPLQRKLERMELDHLRQHALELHERLERAEADLQRADESAEFWQRHAHELQLALLDDDHATHRCVGINKAGEMMVVRTDGHAQAQPDAQALLRGSAGAPG